MHICHVTSAAFPPQEGMGNYIYGLSKELIKNGHEVSIITRGPWKVTTRENFENIEIIRIPFIPFYPFYMKIYGFFFNHIFKKLEKNIDVLHVHSPLSPIIHTTRPIITTIHTPMMADTQASLVESSTFKTKIEKLMGRFVSYPLELNLLKRANIITAVAKSVALELKEYNFNQKEIIIIGNGVDKNIFIASDNKTTEKYILFTGRLAQRKGLFDLIECGKYICEKYPNVYFIISGKGILLNILQKKVEELGLKDKFKFVGFVDRKKLVNLYQNATIYVLPSHYEGLPTVLLEAMACGLPVVATSVSGNLDVIKSNENGILVPPKSPKEMADAISLLLEDEKFRKNIGKNARKTIEELYSWDVISNNYIAYYKLLIKQCVGKK